MDNTIGWITLLKLPSDPAQQRDTWCTPTKYVANSARYCALILQLFWWLLLLHWLPPNFNFQEESAHGAHKMNNKLSIFALMLVRLHNSDIKSIRIVLRHSFMFWILSAYANWMNFNHKWKNRANESNKSIFVRFQCVNLPGRFVFRFVCFCFFRALMKCVTSPNGTPFNSWVSIIETKLLFDYIRHVVWISFEFLIFTLACLYARLSIARSLVIRTLLI